MKMFWLDPSDKEAWLPRMFDLYFVNMDTIVPSGRSYGEERAEWMANVSPALDKAPRRVLLAVDREELAGFVQYYTRAELLMVEEVQLRRDFQGTVLFLAMCRKILGSLPRGIRWVEAYADRRNGSSAAMMKRLGMEEIEEAPGFPFLHLRGDGDVIFPRLGHRGNSIQ